MDDQALQPWRPCKRPLDQRSTSASMDRNYDVFLNHRGPDVKAGFISHLDEALRAAGLNPFLDKASLRKGHPAFTSIEDALEVAKIHVVVISKGYAQSKYCLSELVTIMRSGKPVVPVFYDVEPAQVRWVESGPFAEAFEKHKLKRSTEQVEEWKDALRKLSDITGLCFRLADYKGDEVELKWEVVDAILNLTPTMEALDIDCHLVGVQEPVHACISKLQQMSDVTCILGLTGMGGVGKTSVAKEIYNHFVGHNRFQGMCFLEIDRHSPSSMEVGRSLVSRLQEQLLWDLLHVSESNRQRYKYWFNKLSSQGPILVVLDDLCEKSQFDEVILNKRLLAQGSCIIVTSRDQHVLKVISGESNFYLHEVQPLECDDAQKLFNLHAFGDEEAPMKFKGLANDVSRGCGGLPLALKVVGSSLFDKRSDEDIRCIWLEAIEALKKDASVKSVLKWSYDCLSKEEKLMFVDIAWVFVGWKKNEALEIWKSCKGCSSCGLTTPHVSLRGLIDKSLVGLEYFEGGDALTMHDLLRDLGQSIGMSKGSHLREGKAKKVMEHKVHGLEKVRALNLASKRETEFKTKNFRKMTNLHFLVLDGCNVIGDLGRISEELQWLQWRYMPLSYIPPMLNLKNLISLDFSWSTMLARTWVESDPALEGCPNLLKLDLRHCTSITTLPDSIGHLSRLQELDLSWCESLQKLPSSIGQLTALQKLYLADCGSLEAMPDSITALSGLRTLWMIGCSSISKLPSSFGLMSNLALLYMDLDTEGHALALGQLNTLTFLVVSLRSDHEAVSVLDSLGTLRNLQQLFRFGFFHCYFMTKLPETIGLLTNLNALDLNRCYKLRKLPNSIGQLKLLRLLNLRKCLSLETLPGSLGGLTCLQELWIARCISFKKLPTSIGSLFSLRVLSIKGCDALQSLPEGVMQLNALSMLTIMDCGSLEGMRVMRALQGLRIWGSRTSITSELPGSRLMVVDSNFFNPASYVVLKRFLPVYRSLKEVQVVEVDDCGYFRLVQERQSGRLMWQRVHT